MNKIDINSYETNASNSIPLKVHGNNLVVQDQRVTQATDQNYYNVTDESGTVIEEVIPELAPQITTNLQSVLLNIRTNQQKYENRLFDN